MRLSTPPGCSAAASCVQGVPFGAQPGLAHVDTARQALFHSVAFQLSGWGALGACVLPEGSCVSPSAPSWSHWQKIEANGVGTGGSPPAPSGPRGSSSDPAAPGAGTARHAFSLALRKRAVSPEVAKTHWTPGQAVRKYSRDQSDAPLARPRPGPVDAPRDWAVTSSSFPKPLRRDPPAFRPPVCVTEPCWLLGSVTLGPVSQRAGRRLGRHVTVPGTE